MKKNEGPRTEASTSQDQPVEGMKHLRIALDLYKQWGAMNKAADLEQFIESKTSFCIEVQCR